MAKEDERSYKEGDILYFLDDDMNPQKCHIVEADDEELTVSIKRSAFHTRVVPRETARTKYGYSITEATKMKQESLKKEIRHLTACSKLLEKRMAIMDKLTD